MGVLGRDLGSVRFSSLPLNQLTLWTTINTVLYNSALFLYTFKNKNGVVSYGLFSMFSNLIILNGCISISSVKSFQWLHCALLYGSFRGLGFKCLIHTRNAKNIQWGNGNLSTNDVGKTESLCKTTEEDLYLIPLTNINSKWIKDVNVRLETIEHLEENTGENILDIGLGNDVLDITQVTKARTDKEMTSKYRHPSLSIHRTLVSGVPAYTKIQWCSSPIVGPLYLQFWMHRFNQLKMEISVHVWLNLQMQNLGT